MYSVIGLYLLNHLFSGNTHMPLLYNIIIRQCSIALYLPFSSGTILLCWISIMVVKSISAMAFSVFSLTNPSRDLNSLLSGTATSEPKYSKIFRYTYHTVCGMVCVVCMVCVVWYHTVYVCGMCHTVCDTPNSLF